MFFDFLIVCKFLKFLIYGLNVVLIVIFLGIVIDRLLGIWYGFKLGFLIMR